MPPWALALIFVLLTAYAGALALRCWEAPVPGLFTDPFAVVTNFGWPSWSGYQEGIAFPAQVVQADGQDLLSYQPGRPYPAERLAAVAGPVPGTEVGLVLSTPLRGLRPVTVRVERLAPVAWLVLYAGYALLAWLWLLAAGVAYQTYPDNQAAGAFARWAVLNAIMLLTLFDYHTTHRLVLPFLAAMALLPAAVIELGLRFPDDIAPLRRRPGLILAPRALGAVLLGLVGFGWFTGRNCTALGALATGASLIFLAAQLVLRWHRAEGQRRTLLLLGAAMWAPISLLIGLMLVLMPQRGGVYLFCVAVPISGLGTLGIAYALVRYDLWGGRGLVKRQVLRPVLTALTGLGAGLVFATLVAALEQTGASWVLCLGAFLLGAVLVPLHRVVGRWIDAQLFPTDMLYRPTVEQLSLRFADLGSPSAVVEAVETTVRQWLPCDQVRFLPLPAMPRGDDDSGEMYRSLPPVAAMAVMMLSRGGDNTGQSGVGLHLGLNMPSNAGLLSLPPTAEPPEWRILRRAARHAGIDGIGHEQAAALCKGEVVHPQPASRHAWARVVIPARFRDQTVGLLAVSARPARLFTGEDENLLRTIANQAALALACASATAEVETLRKAQQAAYSREKEAALAAFAAEIAHETRTPINFFRFFLDSTAAWVRDGLPPEAEHDVEIGRQEIERLERMAGNLRRIATPRRLDRQRVDLRTLLEHVRMLLRDRLQNRLLELEVDPLLEVDCDRDAMTQVLVNLMNNAIDACPPPGRVGVSAEALNDGRLRLTVWDMGHGLLADVGKLFQPLFTTKKTGSGLGLPITRRLVRAHGWEIGAARRGDRTCFDVIVLQEEWRTRPPPLDEGQFESNPLH